MFRELPPATRCWVAAGVVVTGAVAANVVEIKDIFFHWRIVLNGEWWRALTSLFYLGDVSFYLALNLYFTARSAADYEKVVGTAVFVWHWILGVACCLFAAFVMQQGNSITGTSLLPGLALSYVFQTMFCCRIPRARVSFFGQVMDARYLSFFTLGVKVFMGESPESLVVGHIIAHVLHSHFMMYPLLESGGPVTQAVAAFFESGGLRRGDKVKLTFPEEHAEHENLDGAVGVVYALPPEAEGRYIVVVAPGEGRAEPRTLSLTRERLVFHERHLL